MNKRKTKVVLIIILNLFIIALVSNIIMANGKITWDSALVKEKKYIRWVEFNLSLEVMEKTSKLDIESHVANAKIKYNWIELISYLACKYGNDFNKFKQKDLDSLIQKLQSGIKMQDLTKDLQYYNYYFESYSAILEEFIGPYEIQVEKPNGEIAFEKRYGIKAFMPIAKGYSFGHYRDFGVSRSYGYRRQHLGNDLMGSIGTPVIAVESGIIEACGWNQYRGMENRNKKF